MPSSPQATNSPEPAFVYWPSPLFRWLPVVGLVGLALLAGLGFAAAVMSGVQVARWVAFVLLAAAAFFVYNYWQTAYTATVDGGVLLVERFGRTRSIPLAAISAVELGASTLTVYGQGDPIQLYGDPPGLAQFLAILQQYCPQLRSHEAQREFRPLPVVHRRPFWSHAGPPLAFLLLAIGMLGMLIVAWRTDAYDNPAARWLVTGLAGCFAIVVLAVAIMMLVDHIDHVVFDHSTIIVYRLGRSRAYAVPLLREIRLKANERSVRGFRRTFYSLELLFRGNTPLLEIGPTFADSIGISQEQARSELEELRDTLCYHYDLHHD